MKSRVITNMPYKENNSLLVMVYFMSRSALATVLQKAAECCVEVVFGRTIYVFLRSGTKEKGLKWYKN